MRKTRLVILPGVRSITQIGCLLLFLACPTIAFKGQEKRDVEPMCKFHELKYWWLPFDTGEGKNSTIPQKWPGYECQRDNMAITNGKEKDNVTDSIQHSCDETKISHRRVVIQGQDENYNLETNFRRNKMRVIHSLAVSEIPSKRIGSSERRTTGRREVPQTVHKTERVSQTPVERRVAFYKYQRSTTDRQAGFSSEQGGIGSRARTIIQNRFQQNRREGSETQIVNDRRRLVPVSERRHESKKIRLSTRINAEFTGSYQNLESQKDSRERSEQSDKRVSALVGTDQRMELNGINRDNNSPQQNAQRSCPEYRNSRMYKDKSRIGRKLEQNSSPTRQERRETIHHSQVRIIQRKIQEEQPRMDRRRESFISMDNERSLSDKRRAVLSADSSLDRRMREDNIQRNVGILENYRTRGIRSEILRESRNDMRMKIPLVQNMLRHKSSPIYKTSRETTNRSEITIIQRTNDEEESRMVRRRESAITRDDERSLYDRRRPVRSVDSLLFSLERKLAESDKLRNSRIRERDISRENIPSLQKRRLSSPENTQRPSFIRVQPKDSREESRIERRLERAMNNDNEKRLSNRRSGRRSSESSVFSLDRRMGMVNLRDDNRKYERDISRENSSPIQQRSSYGRRENIRQSPVTTSRSLQHVVLLNDEQRLSNRRAERGVESLVVSLNRNMKESTQRRDTRMQERDLSRENIPSMQNILRLLSSPERRENIQRSSFIRVQGKDIREQSRIDRRIERAVNNDNERLSRSRRSVDSRASSLDRRVGETTQRRDIRMHERDISREDTLRLENKLQRRSSPERENIQRSSFISVQGKNNREQSRIDRRIERAVNNDNERLSRSRRSVDSRASSLDRRVGETNQRRDIIIHERDISHEGALRLENKLQRSSSFERRENIQRSSLIVLHPKDSREQSRTDRRTERAVNNDNEQRLSRSRRSVDSRPSSLDRRVGEPNQLRDIRLHERDISRENSSPLQNILRRLSSPERRENIQRSSFIRVQPKDSREQSRIDRRLEREVNNDNERRMSNRRAARSADSRVSSLDRRVGETNQRRNIRMHEREISREERSSLIIVQPKDSREQSRIDRRLERAVNNDNERRMSNRRAARSADSRVSSLDRRVGETNQRRDIRMHEREISREERSSLIIVQPKDSREQSRIDRRLERAVNNDNERRLSNKRSVRSVDARVFSIDRRVGRLNTREDIRKHKRDISRDSISPVQITLQQRNSLDRRETILQSQFTIIKSKESREQYRTDRRLERVVSINDKRCLSNRRSDRCLESREVSFERIMGERRDIILQKRDISRGNVLLLENKLQRRSSSERREIILRSAVTTIHSRELEDLPPKDRRSKRAVYMGKEQRGQSTRDSERTIRFVESRVFSLARNLAEPNFLRDIRVYDKDSTHRIRPETLIRVQSKDSMGRSKTERRLERAMNNDNEQSLFNRRSARSLESLHRRMGMLNIREDIRKQRRDISRDNSSPLRQRNSLERRENIRESTITITKPKDSRGQSGTGRSLGRVSPINEEQRLSNRWEERSLEAYEVSLNRRWEESNQRRDIRMEKRDISRDNASPLQNTLRRLSSPERRENIQRSSFIRVQGKDSREQSKIDRRLERGVNNDNERLSNRRPLRSIESRVFSLERKFAESDLQRDGRIRERDLSRENISPLQNRRLSSPERRENSQRSSFIRVQPIYSREQSRTDRRLERSVNNDNERRLSDRRSLRSVESRFYSIDRRMTNLREDIRKDERDISRDTSSPIQRNLYERKEKILQSREQSRIDKRLERGLLMDKEQFSSSRRSVGSLKSRVFSLDRRMPESNLRRGNEMQVNDRTRSNMLRVSRNPIRENTFRLQNSIRQLSSPALIDRRESSHRAVFSIIKPTDFERQSRVDTRLKPADSNEDEQRLSYKRLVRSVDSRVFLQDGRIPESRMDRRIERAISIDNKHLSDMRRSLRSREISMYRHEKDMSREESFPRRLKTGVSQASSAQRFRELRTVFNTVEISHERKFETLSRRNKLENVDRREDVSRFNNRHTQERRVILNQRSISERTNDLRRQTSSSERHLSKKPSSSRQRTDIPVASTARVSKYELHLSTMLDMSQNYDEAQLSNTRKSASFSPSWNGKLISAIKKAVTGSDDEETILKDSGLKYSQGFTHERQIRELRPDSEIRSNDKGHLLQDFVMGSVIAGFFISSIHQKLRDYRNFICIF